MLFECYLTCISYPFVLQKLFYSPWILKNLNHSLKLCRFVSPWVGKTHKHHLLSLRFVGFLNFNFFFLPQNFSSQNFQVQIDQSCWVQSFSMWNLRAWPFMSNKRHEKSVHFQNLCLLSQLFLNQHFPVAILDFHLESLRFGFFPKYGIS